MRRSRAFTLVEILIVVVILGILAAISVPQFASATQDSSRTATVEQLARLRRAIQVYYFKNGSVYPSISAGTATWGELLAPGSPYMREAPANTWVGGPNAKDIIIATGADTGFASDHGWVFNPATGDVWAAGFDDQDNPFPHP